MPLAPSLRVAFGFLAALVLSPLNGRAVEYGKVVPASADTYSVTLRANNVFTRNPKKFKAQATKLANEFCAEHGKQYQFVDETVSHPMLPPDNLTYTLIFKAIEAAPASIPAPAGSPAVATAPAGTPTDLLYSELMKLDELRKKGLLTDAEFDSEKQKILSRSR